MPYSLTKQGSKWIVKNKDTGDVKGTHDSYAKALRQFRLLEAVKRGWKPTGAKSKLKRAAPPK